MMTEVWKRVVLQRRGSFASSALQLSGVTANKTGCEFGIKVGAEILRFEK